MDFAFNCVCLCVARKEEEKANGNNFGERLRKQKSAKESRLKLFQSEKQTNEKRKLFNWRLK